MRARRLTFSCRIPRDGRGDVWVINGAKPRQLITSPSFCIRPRSAVSVSLSCQVTPAGGELDLPICVHPRWKFVPSWDAGKVQFEHLDDNEIEKSNENLSDSRAQESHLVWAPSQLELIVFWVVFFFFIIFTDNGVLL